MPGQANCLMPPSDYCGRDIKTAFYHTDLFSTGHTFFYAFLLPHNKAAKYVVYFNE